MPSTTSSVVSIDFASSTVIVPSLPTLSMASAMISPIVLSQLAETVATCAISVRSLTFFEIFFNSSTINSTALLMPRCNACRAFSSNCNCLAAISYFLLRLTDDAEDVVLAHDQVRLIVDLDFSAAVFRDQHLVAFFHGEIDLLAFFVHLARAESDDF